MREDRAAFCKQPHQTCCIDGAAGDVEADLFGRLRDFDHKPDRRLSLPTGRQAKQAPAD
jgi:hypothetical protein